MAQQLIEQQLMQAAQVVESQIDDEIHKLDNMDKDELEVRH